MMGSSVRFRASAPRKPSKTRVRLFPILASDARLSFVCQTPLELLGEDVVVHRLGGFVPKVVQNVRVGVERYLDVRVSEARGHGRNRQAAGRRPGWRRTPSAAVTAQGC